MYFALFFFSFFSLTSKCISHVEYMHMRQTAVWHGRKKNEWKRKKHAESKLRCIQWMHFSRFTRMKCRFVWKRPNEWSLVVWKQMTSFFVWLNFELVQKSIQGTRNRLMMQAIRVKRQCTPQNNNNWMLTNEIEVFFFCLDGKV